MNEKENFRKSKKRIKMRVNEVGEETRRGDEGRRGGMQMIENSLHKCEHHACTHTHTHWWSRNSLVP